MSQTVPSSSLALTLATTAQASSSAAPAFQFAVVDEMYTCGVAGVQWTYSGPSAPMALNITNVNVDQQAPLGTNTATTTTTTTSRTAVSSTPVTQRDIAIGRRQYSGYGGSYLPQINEQLATQLDPLVGIWRWPSANIPQGWYRMLATVQGVLEASSSTFFVQNGSDVSCVLQFYPTSSSTAVTLTSALHLPTTTATTTTSSSKAISHTGAIAGGIVGGVAAVILAIGAVAFARRRRRRDNQMRRKSVDPSFSNALVMRAGRAPEGTLTPFTVPQMDQQRHSDHVGTPPPVLLNLPQAIPVGLSSKELAQLRSRALLQLQTEPTGSPSSSSDSRPTLPPIVTATTGPDEVTPSSEATTRTTLESEVEYLRREVQRLHAQQVRAREGFEAPPSYGEARSP